MGFYDKYVLPQAQPSTKGGALRNGGFLDKFGTGASNIANSIFKGVVDPFVKVVGSGIREIQSVPSLLRGDLAESERIAKQPIFGQKTLEGSSNLENIGTAAQVASNLVGGGKAIPSIFKGAVTRSTIAGGTAGALQGGGGYLANTEDPTISGFVKNTAIGGGTGAVLGGGIAAAQKIAQLPKTARQGLQDTYEELFTGTKPAKKTLFKSTAKGQNPAKFGADKGYIVEVSKDGKINSQPLIRQVQTDVQPTQQDYRSILEVMDDFLPENQKVNLDLLGDQAKTLLRTPKAKGAGILPDSEKAVDRIVNNLKQTYGDRVSLSQLDDIRSGQWSESSSFNISKPNFEKDVNYALGKAAKTSLAKKTAGTPTANKLLDEIADHYDFIENLRKIDGNTVKGGRLGKYTARVIGATIGSQGGPVGAIAGERAGNFIAEIANSNAIAGPVKRRVLESIPRSNPLYQEAQDALNNLFKSGVEKQVNTKALPARSINRGSAIRNPAKEVNLNPVVLPKNSQSTLDTKEIQNMIRSRIIKPSGISKSQEITQVFGGKGNIKTPRFKKK